MTGDWEKSLINWVESESKLQKRQLGSEMEFLDISLAKDSILLLNAIHTVRFFNWRILKKTILYFGFNNPFKKIRETRNIKPTSLFMNSIL